MNDIVGWTLKQLDIAYAITSKTATQLANNKMLEHNNIMHKTLLGEI